MKIGFDVSDLCTNRADGTTRYTRELAKRLPLLDSLVQWQFIAPGSSEASRNLPANAQWISTPFPKYWTQLRMPFTLQAEKLDVMFMPIQQIPFLRPKKTKYVAVIHDLAFHYYPQQTTYKDWLLLHMFTAYVARKADRIIAVSQATADDIAKHYGRKTNVHVIHHGVNHDQFRLPRQGELESSWERLAAAFSPLKRPYLLFVGQIQPRKNLERLIEAFELLKQAKPELQLVIAGSHGWLQEPIKARAAASVYTNDIVFLDRVPDELLTPLYWHADVFVLPSLYEGFGMPLLEAMASGCPVVTSNVSSMPEVVGQAAVLVDPLSSASVAAGIETALSQRDKLKQQGIEQAKLFSWNKTAQATLKALL